MDQYLAQGQLDGTADRTTKVKVDKSAEISNLQQQAGIGNAILAGAKMYLDQMQNADIMKASNMYNDKMSELRSKLLLNKEENAMDNMAKYEEGRQKILEEIYKNGPKFVRAGLGKQKFDQSIEKDWIGQKNQMRGYVMTEGEKYQDNQLANRLLGYNQNISDGWSNGVVLAANVEAGEEEIKKRYKYYGAEKINSAINQWRGQAYNNAITMAVGAENYDQAGALLQGYGKWLDPNTRANIDKIITARKRSDSLMSSIDGLFAKYGENANAAWTEFSKTLTGGNIDVAKEANKMIGQKLGNNTCAIFVGKMITAAGGDTSLISTLADGTYLNYENRGLTFTDRNQLRDGDLVFWKSLDRYETTEDKNAIHSTDKAYKGITHCGIYDAKSGKVIQSGTSGVSAIGVDTYKFIAAAHQPAKAMNATELEKERQQFFSHYDSRINRMKKQENLYIENAANQLLALSKDGQNYTKQDLEKVIYKMTGNNAKMYTALLPLATSLAKQQIDVLPVAAQIELEDAIGTGQVTQKELVTQLSKYNLAPETIMKYIHMNKQAISKKGEFKYDWGGLAKALYAREGGKDKVTEEQMMGAIIYGKRFVRDFQLDDKNKGKNLSPGQILDQMEDSLTKNEINFSDGGFFSKDIQFTPAELALKGIYNIQEPSDKSKVIVYRYGNAYGELMTKEAFLKEMR